MSWLGWRILVGVQPSIPTSNSVISIFADGSNKGICSMHVVEMVCDHQRKLSVKNLGMKASRGHIFHCEMLIMNINVGNKGP
jgi:hypothetical protein